MRIKNHLIALALTLSFGGLGCVDSHAALPDEIQVYDDGINTPGETGLELHLNRTQRGRSIPLYPGEVPPNRATRITPEFSYGISPQWEAGLYLPSVVDAHGAWALAGTKLRLKWIGQRAEEGGWFYGANLELSKIRKPYEESMLGFELRPILGYRWADWLVATNPILHKDLSPGYRSGGMDFTPAIKISRQIAEGLSAGIETYSDLGRLAKLSPAAQQEHSVYAVLDVERGPWVMNIGIGRGLNAQTDRWTIKAIIEIPMP